MGKKHLEMALYLLLLFVPLSRGLAVESPSCLDAEGKSVSFWVALKPPDTLSDYFYRDENSSPCTETNSECFGAKKRDLGSSNAGPLARTMQQIYAKDDFAGKIAYLMFNDDPPFDSLIETHDVKAHSKGVFAIGESGGFWLVHSVPRFPTDRVGVSRYSGLSSNARVNGQSFLCLSLSTENINRVLEQVRLAHPLVYHQGGFTRDMLAELVHIGVQTQVLPLTLSNGLPIISLYKSASWGKDFYDDLVAPALNANLLVNTWNNGLGTLPTFCSSQSCRSVRFPNRRNVCLPSCASNPEDCVFDYDVENVMTVRLNRHSSWINSKDHSKWAITAPSSETKAVCIGDINRQRGQRLRGGGAVCLKDENLWRAFNGIIGEVEMCQN